MSFSRYDRNVNFLRVHALDKAAEKQLVLDAVADTILDADRGQNFRNKNYGASPFGAVADNGSAMLVKFDLSSASKDLEVKSAYIELTKLGWDGKTFEVRELINNNWIEGTGKGTKAKDGEPTYNRLAHKQKLWNSQTPWLAKGYDYSNSTLVDNAKFVVNGTERFELNANGIDVLNDWIQGEPNYGFAIVNANDWIKLGSRESKFKPKLIINYTEEVVLEEEPVEAVVVIEESPSLLGTWSVDSNTGDVVEDPQDPVDSNTGDVIEDPETDTGDVVDIPDAELEVIELKPIADTLLDGDTHNNFRNINYGKSKFGGVADNGSTMLIKFDLSDMPEDKDLTKASLKLNKLAWPGTEFEVRELINNDWIEGKGKEQLAKDGEPTFNRLAHNQELWYGDGPWLKTGLDYSDYILADDTAFTSRGSYEFELNSTGLDTIAWWIDGEDNYGFAIVNADDWIKISSREDKSSSPVLILEFGWEKVEEPIVEEPKDKKEHKDEEVKHDNKHEWQWNWEEGLSWDESDLVENLLSEISNNNWHGSAWTNRGQMKKIQPEMDGDVIIIPDLSMINAWKNKKKDHKFDKIYEKFVSRYLAMHGYSVGTGAAVNISSDTLVGDKNLRLANKLGKLWVPVVFKSKSKIEGKHIEVKLPKNANWKNASGANYTGDMNVPITHTTWTLNVSWIDILSVFKVGAEEEIKFTDDTGESLWVGVTVPAPWMNVGDMAKVYFSQDNASWEYLLSTGVILLDSSPYVMFTVDHFTYFAVWANTGTFTINNDNPSTSTETVTLNINAPWAVEMRFGNTPAQRDVATWETYATSKSWTLEPNNGTKTVYAAFKDSIGDVYYVDDTIVLAQAQGIDIYPAKDTALDSYAGYQDYNYGVADHGYLWQGSTMLIYFDLNSIPKGSTVTTADLTLSRVWSNGTTFNVREFINNPWIEGTKNVATASTGEPTYNYREYNTVRWNNGSAGVVEWVDYGTTNLVDSPTFSANETKVFALNNAWLSTIEWWINSWSSNLWFALVDGNDWMQIGSRENTTVTNRPKLSITYVPDLIVPTANIIYTPASGTMISGTVLAELTGFSESVEITNNWWNNTYLFTGGGTFTFTFEDIAGNEWTAVSTVDWLDNTKPTAIVDYVPSTTISGDVIAILTGYSEPITITNNSGLNEYTFSDGGTFTFEYIDIVWNTWSTTALVDWIDKTPPTAIVEYSPNSGTYVSGSVVVTLTWYSEDITITNNGWSNVFEFFDNGIFTFQYEDNFGLTGSTTATVDWINIDRTPIIGGLRLKFDAADVSSLTLGAGNEISVWNDISGNWNNVTQVDTAAQPLLVDNVINGNPVVRFDGTSDYLPVNFGYTSTDYLSGMMVCSVFRTTFVGSKYNDNWSILDFDRSDYFNFYIAADTNTLWFSTRAGNATRDNQGTTILNDGNPYIACASFDTSQVNETNLYVNWSLELSVDNYTTDTLMGKNSTRYAIIGDGSEASAFDWNRNKKYYDGDIAEIIYFDTALTNAERENIECYLSSKWWVTVPHVCDTTPPTATIDYNINTPTSGDVIATLTGISESGVVIQNNGWSDLYLFTGNGSFTFLYKDPAGNIGTTTATVSNIDKVKPTADITYYPDPLERTGWDILAVLENESENITITNNSGSNQYVFTGNGTFTFNYIDVAGNTWSNTVIVDWMDFSQPQVVATSPLDNATWVDINQDIVVEFSKRVNPDTISGQILIDPAVTGINYSRSGTKELIISHDPLNYQTTYTVTILTGITDSVSNNLDAEYQFSFTTKDKASLSYSADGFIEDILNNDWSIEEDIIVALEWDQFDSNIVTSGYVSLSNIPIGLTSEFILNSGTELVIRLNGNASNHLEVNSINNLQIVFDNNAFVQFDATEVTNSDKQFYIDFNDAYQGSDFYSIADNTLDADTDPNNGCANGVCQEMNYGALDFGGLSDFGSVLLMQFDLSSIPAGAEVHWAKLRLTRYDIGSSQGKAFSMKKVINNDGWIEWVWSYEAALPGESNYKQRKRQQENWANGNPGMVEWVDYDYSDMFDNATFDTVWDETKEFTLNSTWVNILRDWINHPTNNQWVAFVDTDTDWLYVRTKEYNRAAERPMLTVYYTEDTTAPTIDTVSPPDDSIDISVDSNLIITFNEEVTAVNNRNIEIRKTIDDSLVESINANSTQVTINSNIITIVPSTGFESNTEYYVLIDGRAFRDVAGNDFAGISNKNVWNFKTVNVAASPIIDSTPYQTWVESTTAIFGGTILGTGSTNIIERGIFRSLMDGFNDGDGTKVSESGNWANTWHFEISVSGLFAGIQTFFKSFVRNSEWVAYSDQGSFVTKPAKPIGLNTTRLNNTSFIANWNAVTWTMTYKLYVATDSNFDNYLTWYAPMMLSGDVTSYRVEWLNRETFYYYKLIASNTGWDSIESDTVQLQTTFLSMPEAWLKLDETAWSIAYDSINNHNGILEGTTTQWLSGADNLAYGFNGTDSRITIVDFNYGSDMSIGFRFKSDGTWPNSQEYVFSYGDDADANSINVILDHTAQALKTNINWQSDILNINSTFFPTLLDDQWHLYTLTIDDDGEVPWQKLITVYIDGEAKAAYSGIAAGVFDPTTNMVFGRRSSDPTSSYFKGQIDDIRLYDTLLTAEEAQTSYAAFADLESPTAYVVYNPSSGTVVSGSVIATLTGASEPIVITNNGWSDSYVFSDNGTFTFQFRDAALNTGIAIAEVTWLDNQAPTLSNASTISSWYDQSPEFSFISDEAGTITVTGACSVSSVTPNTAISGNNTITFDYLPVGTYTGCGITVTDGVGHTSDVLYINDFDLISLDPVSIWAATGIYLTGSTSEVATQINTQFTDYFRVNDPAGSDDGYYITIAITDLVASWATISAANIYMRASWIDVLEWVANPNVVVSSVLSNYVSLASPITYLKRDTWPNSFLRGKYGNKPELRIDLPAYQAAGQYQGTITYTLYEN